MSLDQVAIIAALRMFDRCDEWSCCRFRGVDLGREAAPEPPPMIAVAPSTKNRDGKRTESLALSVTWQVAMRPGQRKALPKTTEGELLERIAQAKARIRAKAEHPFHGVKNLFHHHKTGYKGLAKNTAQLFSLMLACRWLLDAPTQAVS